MRRRTSMVYFLRVNSYNNDRRTSANTLDRAREKAIDILSGSTNRVVFIERERVRLVTDKKYVATTEIIGYMKRKEGKRWEYHNTEKKIVQYIHDNGKPYPIR